MLTKSCSKVAPKFLCEICDYSTSKKSSFDKHLLTAKHINLTKTNKKLLKSCSEIINPIFTCEFCNKDYKSRVGLWSHKKKCEFRQNCDCTNDVNNEMKSTENEKDIVTFLMKENNEFKQLLLEQNNQILTLVNKRGNNFNSNNINSNNKTFNLNMFLNETCKDAMNITDFMNSIELDLNDLINVGEMGYINGISNIIIKNLKELDITQRPIHCTDAKRETLYIKDKDKWEKEDEHKEIMICFVKNIANKNIRMISEYKRRYPDCGKYESRYSDQYNKLIIEAMGGGSDKDERESNEKIIKKISKEVIIDKSIL
jgi:hypothetical protein